ncbi:MAG: recombinase family protein [Candidatus Yanofskybacteria bacterium]|nr:recombinase family protein [Candidatus Yanofskybacteria bacterium]
MVKFMELNTSIKYAAYRRKSTDDERQVLSLRSQKDEMERRFPHMKTVELDPESVSAFKPYKRPVFKKMLEMVEAGKVQGIVAWHPDRLSRNPIDAAQIIYLLDTGKLKDLKFCSYHFDNSPEGKMMLQIVMSQSKYSSDKLSKDVKRGMDTKANTSGYRPGLAPLGYLNSNTNIRGTEIIFNDPKRFNLVKQVWQLMLTGNYTVPALLRIVNEEIHLTQPATKKRPERKLTLNVLYGMFTSSFYYGWYEWPMGSGNWVKGNPEAMITEKEFDHVQFLLGRKGRPRPKNHKFAFTGVMKCVCGAAITAEEKFKKQKNGKVHHYIYYRCTRKINPNCTQKAIEVKNLVKQIDEILEKITISERFQKWALYYLHEVRKEEAKTREDTISAKHKEYERTTTQLDNLVLKYTSPENKDGQILTDEEYIPLRSRLLKIKSDLAEELKHQDKKIEEWVEITERTFNFARYARMNFAEGSLELKKSIFACLGSDLLLEDQKVRFILRKPFNFIFEGREKVEYDLSRLEPVKNGLNTELPESFALQFPVLSG